MVFAAVEVDGCLAADCGIDHADEGGGDVDVADAALIAGSHEATEVGDAATAEVDEDGVAVGVGVEKSLPQLGGDGNVFAFFAYGDFEEFGFLQAFDAGDEPWQAVGVGVFVDENEEAGIVEGLA